MSSKQEVLKNLPAVDKLLLLPEVKLLLSCHGKEPVIFCIRIALNTFRTLIQKGNPQPTQKKIVEKINELLTLISKRSLKNVFNATGIIIHTNLGRSPFSDDFLNESIAVLKGYNNLEFDLNTASRGSRHVHAAEILKFLTGAEDVLVVNNAAAAVMLILRTFAKRREVIVSRSELIEIGGSFRLPEIMKASDCKMVEVGTTNKTRISDFRAAISPKTALIFKAHKSNYVIKGFTEEPLLSDLVAIGQNTGIPVVYDLGSGLLLKNMHPAFKDEPSAMDALLKGVDMVCFSGDKLLGGPQAGIIAGRKDLIAKLKKEPMLRALRVCKTTLAMLETVCRYHLDIKLLKEKSILHKLIFRQKEEIKNLAEQLKNILIEKGIQASVIPSEAYIGGGTLPDKALESYAVVLEPLLTRKKNELFAELMYKALLKQSQPILGILKKGTILLNMHTLETENIKTIADAIEQEYRLLIKNNIL